MTRFDERLPVPVFVFVHLHCIKMCIVGQVITRIGTGQHPRQICDDIARHLEWGARLVHLFAELGNFFPLLRSCNLLSLEVVPDRRAPSTAFLRARTWLSSGGGGGGRFRASKVRFNFTGCIFSSGGGFFFAKKSFTSARQICTFSSLVLSYGNFSRGVRVGPNLYCLRPLAVLLDAGAAGAAAALFLRCLRGGEGGGVLRRAGAAGAAVAGAGGGGGLLGRAGAGGEGGGVPPCAEAAGEGGGVPPRVGAGEEGGGV